MEPKYSAIISRFTKSGIDVIFARPVAPETTQKMRELERFSGVAVHNQPGKKDGVFVIWTEIWDYDSVVEEVVSILISEGFDRDSILVKQ